MSCRNFPLQTKKKETKDRREISQDDGHNRLDLKSSKIQWKLHIFSAKNKVAEF